MFIVVCIQGYSIAYTPSFVRQKKQKHGGGTDFHYENVVDAYNALHKPLRFLPCRLLIVNVTNIFIGKICLYDPDHETVLADARCLTKTWALIYFYPVTWEDEHVSNQLKYCIFSDILL
jgi:hypothetical protein